jgi:hypothetical protein
VEISSIDFPRCVGKAGAFPHVGISLAPSLQARWPHLGKIPASRSNSALPKTWYSRSRMRRLVGPLSIPCASSTSANNSMSLRLYREANRCR